MGCKVFWVAESGKPISRVIFARPRSISGAGSTFSSPTTLGRGLIDSPPVPFSLSESSTIPSASTAAGEGSVFLSY